MTTKITYNQLYTDMVKCFSVNKNNNEYKLGDYMRMKAKKAKEEAKVTVEALSEKQSSNLPVAAVAQNASGAITALFSYVNEKLTVKRAPVRDKTIRRFPLRATVTAFCSALVMCALMVCYGLIGLHSNHIEDTMQSESYEAAEVVEDNLYYTDTPEDLF